MIALHCLEVAMQEDTREIEADLLLRISALERERVELLKVIDWCITRLPVTAWPHLDRMVARARDPD